MTDTNPRDLIKRLAEKLDHLHCYYNVPDQSALISEARALLSQPEPEEPTEEEILELSGEHFDYRGDSMGGWFIPISISPTIKLSSQVVTFARAVLARWGAPWDTKCDKTSTPDDQ